MKNKIDTTGVITQIPFLSQAIESNGFFFVSGQIHTDSEDNLVEGTIQEKFDQAIKNVEKILKAANLNLDNVVKLTLWVTEITDVPKINEVYKTYFSDPMPAREAICVKALPLGASVEVSVIAAK